MADSSSLRLAYYGDDFTGSTDALEVLSRAGVPTRLFLDVPSREQIAKEPELRAVGVAGHTRALPPAEMNEVLRPAFAALCKLGAPHVHYKVCSTFDSSPRVGSIGCAIERGAAVFGAPFVPLLVGTPALGRYVAFGNLFARYGIGSAGAIHRLDRHPSISRHPVTPMTEADLRVHLARQTTCTIGLIDYLALDRPETESRAALNAALQDGSEIVLFDTLTPAHLTRIGRLLETYASSEKPLFSVGSSAVEHAVVGVGAAPLAASVVKPATTLVVSGSCSPVTAGQIAWAEANGFAIFEHGSSTVAAIAQTLAAGRNVVVFTSRGEATGPVRPAQELGAALGTLAREALTQTSARRLVIAGGDTSSYAARSLGVQSLSYLASLAPGAPLCRAAIPGSPLDGLEIVFKGGQVGADTFFGFAAQGTSPR